MDMFVLKLTPIFGISIDKMSRPSFHRNGNEELWDR